MDWLIFIQTALRRSGEYTTEEIVEVGTLRVSLDVMAVKLAALYGSRADYLQLLEIAKNVRRRLSREMTQKNAGWMVNSI